ncbi:uncharacterized protein si:ch211-159e12.5 isoform X2 [Danio rerio]|uniref:Uncharacterized protein si:ch211-159e12.5 isoform X2 n=1 Tax=Danio rerio TaxID=7955 RepID=A0AC58GRA0_DANRE
MRPIVLFLQLSITVVHLCRLQHDPTSSYLSDSSDPNTWLTQHSRAARNIYHTTQQNQTPVPTTYPSQRKLSRRELAEYISEVRNLVLREKQRCDKVRHQEREMREAWKNTWPKHWRKTREDLSQHNLPADLQYRPQGSAFGDWRCASGTEEVSGYGHERFQPTASKTEQNPCMWRNMESTFTTHSFRQPPSYTAPPAYSSPKDGGSKGIAQTRSEQTFENIPNLTETRHSGLASNGQCLQNIESCCRGISSGGNWQNIAQNAPQTKFLNLKTQPMTSPGVTEAKQSKLSRWRGGETVFCLVSRMGEVSGVSRSPEEPLRSCVLPLLTESKPMEKIADTPQQNLKDNQEKQKHRENANTLREQPTTVEDSSSAAIPDGNKESLQSSGQEKPMSEKFPLWKEPRLQHNLMEERIEQIPEITNTESLVVIDATCVVVKVELVLLPEKEHVQYVCLTEESPISRTSEETDEQKKNSRTNTKLDNPENQTLDEEAIDISGKPDDHLKTGEQITPQEQDHQSHEEGLIEETEESETTELQNESKPFSGTTLVSNGQHLEESFNIMDDQSIAREPEVMLEEFIALADENLTFETFMMQPEQTTRHLNGETEQENRLTLHKTEDDEKCETDTSEDLSENSSTEDNHRLETADHRELALDYSTPSKNAKEILDCVHQDDLPSTKGTNSLQRSTSSDLLPFSFASDSLDGPNEIADYKVLVLDHSTPFKKISAENVRQVQDCVHQDDLPSAADVQRTISLDSFTFTSEKLNCANKQDDHRELVLDHSTPLSQISGESTKEVQDCVHQDDLPFATSTNSPQRSTSSDSLPFTFASEKCDGNETDDHRELVLDHSTPLFQISAKNAKEVRDCVHQNNLPFTEGTNSLQQSAFSDFLPFTSAFNTLDGSNETGDHGELVLDCSTSVFQISAENGKQIQDCLHQDDLPSTTGTNSPQRSTSLDSSPFTFASEKCDGNETDDHRELALDHSTSFFQISVEKAMQIQDCLQRGDSPFTEGTNPPQRSISSDSLPFTFASDTLDGPHVSDTPCISLTENKPQFLQWSSNPEVSPSIQASCTACSSTPDTTENLQWSTGKPDEDLLCTPSPSKHKAVIPQVRSLWDAVSRIRKHTAPDSETEEDDMTEFGEPTEDADTDCSVRD